MKVFYVCTILLVLALSSAKADFKEDLQKLIKVCQQEQSTTQEELEKYFKSGMDPANANDAIKCHIKCVFEKQGVFKNGAFDEQAFIKQAQDIPSMKDHQAEVVKAASICKKEVGANDCQTAFQISMCLKANRAAVLGNQ